MPDDPAPPASDPPAGTPPPAAPPPADSADPSPPTRDDVIRDPQALIDALAESRAAARRLERWKKDRERSDQQAADANKTELERLTDRAMTAEALLATRESDNLRLEVALEQLLGDDPQVKLAMSLAPRLRGTTREELQADAQQMRQLLGQQPGEPPPPPPPAGGSRLGNGQQPAGTDAAFTAQIRRATGRS